MRSIHKIQRREFQRKFGYCWWKVQSLKPALGFIKKWDYAVLKRSTDPKWDSLLVSFRRLVEKRSAGSSLTGWFAALSRFRLKPSHSGLQTLPWSHLALPEGQTPGWAGHTVRVCSHETSFFQPQGFRSEHECSRLKLPALTSCPSSALRVRACWL